MAGVKWIGGVLTAGLATYVTGVFLAILPAPNQVGSRITRWLFPMEPTRTVMCSTNEVDRASMPKPFDMGFGDRCPGWVHIDDDGNCDYCRVVGYDKEYLLCTLAVPGGSLTGRELKRRLEGGPPYPNECGWLDYQGSGVPAFWRIIGDNHDVKAIDVVRPDGIGDARTQPNVPVGEAMR